MRPERGGGPLSGEKSEKSRPESLDLLLWHMGSEVKRVKIISPALSGGGGKILII